MNKDRVILSLFGPMILSIVLIALFSFFATTPFLIKLSGPTLIQLGYLILLRYISRGKKVFAALLFIGMGCGYTGDIILALDASALDKGIITFGTGYTLMSAALLFFIPFNKKDAVSLPVAAIVMLLLTIVLKDNLKNVGPMLVPVIAYISIVSFLVVCAVKFGTFGKSLLPVIGAALLFFSDSVIVVNAFTIPIVHEGFISLVSYNCGHAILLYSIMTQFLPETNS